MPMSSTIGCISDENVENLPPSTLQCTKTASSKAKSTDYLKERSRRKKWWYFNRGLQPISEVAEIKDDPFTSESYPSITNEDTINNRDDYLNTKNDSLNFNNVTSSENIISPENTNTPQIKESYSPCLKVIEKFQEIVLDSAVRVIQAAFKRFRERRRFLKIKKAVLVIQRNLRKWLQAKHPCLRPAEFERQSSDGSKSDEYRASEDRNVDDNFLTDEDDNTNESNDIIQDSKTVENGSIFDNIETEETEQSSLEETSPKSGLELEINEEHLTDIDVTTSQNEHDIIDSTERNADPSEPIDGGTSLENINGNNETVESIKIRSDGDELQENMMSTTDNASQETMDNNLEEQTHEFLQNDKCTQNCITFVESDVLALSEGAKGFPGLLECDSKIDETQSVVECTQETTTHILINSSEDKTRGEQLKFEEEGADNNISENDDRKPAKPDAEIEYRDSHDDSSETPSNEIPFGELNAENNSNNVNENNVSEMPHRNTLNAEN